MAYLWQRDQATLLDEMIEAKIDAEVVKVCSEGLTKAHLGLKVEWLRRQFQQLHKKAGFNICGEGGEYETAVFDCPLFKTHKILAKKKEVQIHEDNPVVQVAYL